jgi:hypothetical protein
MPESAVEPRRVLLDVDVVLDVLTARQPFFSDSAALVALCESGRCVGMVAAHGVTTLWYLLAKYRDRAFARQAIAGLLRIVRVATVDEAVVAAALALDLPDFEDAVQACAGAAAGADFVATRNVADFSRGPLPVATPADLLPLLMHG